MAKCLLSSDLLTSSVGGITEFTASLGFNSHTKTHWYTLWTINDNVHSCAILLAPATGDSAYAQYAFKFQRSRNCLGCAVSDSSVRMWHISLSMETRKCMRVMAVYTDEDCDTDDTALYMCVWCL